MALETKRAAVNTAMDTLIAALADLMDGLAVGEEVIFLFPTRTWEGVAAATMDNTDGTSPAFSITPALQQRVTWKCRTATSGNSIEWFIPGVDIGGIPLIFKIANVAGEIS